MGAGVQRSVLIAWRPRNRHGAQCIEGCLHPGDGRKSLPSLGYPSSPDIYSIYTIYTHTHTHTLSLSLSLSHTHTVKLNVKAIPLQAWTGPEGSRRLKFPDFKIFGTIWWYDCQLYTPAAFTPQEIFLVLVPVRVWGYPRAIMRKSPGIEVATLRLVPQCSPTAPPCPSIYIHGTK